MKQDKKNSFLWVWLLLFIPIVWVAAVLENSWRQDSTLDILVQDFEYYLKHPFSMEWTQRTAAFIFAAVLCYVVIILLYKSSRLNTRQGEEYGSARWGKIRPIRNRYMNSHNPEDGIQLTANIKISFDTHRHRKNLNVMVIGGSGAGKSRGFALPGILDANCSFLVTDPKSELLRATGDMLEKLGYDVRILDLVELKQSDCYNPMVYLRDDKDTLRLVSNLIKSTTPKTAKAEDPFWAKSETALLTALILYLKHEAPAEEQNFAMVAYMLENAGASEESEDFRSPIDLVFEALEEETPNHIAVRWYKVFQQAAGKTAKSIIVSAAVRLATFLLEDVQRVTAKDDMCLGSLGNRKQAIFIIVPDNGDDSMNYLVSLLYLQTIQELYYQSDKVHHGPLPIPVRLLMDEFQNITLPDDFQKILATCRSRNIHCNIIIQNLAALKAMFKDSWENLTGNCDVLLYLGGNEAGTHEYISKLMGKETINTKTRGLSKGRNGSRNENFQQTGRELMTPDEVRMLDNSYALLFIREEYPLLDRKFDLMKHPRIGLTPYAGGDEYHRAAVRYEQLDLSADFTSVADIEIWE